MFEYFFLSFIIKKYFKTIKNVLENDKHMCSLF